MVRAVNSLEDITATKQTLVDRASEGHAYCYCSSNSETGQHTGAVGHILHYKIYQTLATVNKATLFTVECRILFYKSDEESSRSGTKYMGVPFFASHIRALTESLD